VEGTSEELKILPNVSVRSIDCIYGISYRTSNRREGMKRLAAHRHVLGNGGIGGERSLGHRDYDVLAGSQHTGSGYA
jgi:hypothetical protein